MKKIIVIALIAFIVMKVTGVLNIGLFLTIAIVVAGLIFIGLSFFNDYVKETSVTPDYMNWDKIYRSNWGDSEREELLSITKAQGIKHFYMEYNESKKSFEENSALSTLEKNDKEFVLSFFEDFEKVLDEAEFTKIGKRGEFTLKWHNQNGEEWLYHHWEYRRNSDWDDVMSKGEILKGYLYLRYGYGTSKGMQFWKAYNGEEVRVYVPTRGIVDRERLWQ